MKTATSVARIGLRAAGLTAIVLGVLFWTGNLLALIPVHMLVGIVVVLLLWTLAGLGARAHAPIGLVALGFVWGLVVPALGIMQNRLLSGSAHWVIQVAHLLVGLAALGIGEALARRILDRQSASQSSTPAPRTT